MTPPPPLRVLVVDDHQLFAESLTAALTLDARLDVVGVAHDGRNGLALERELRPDVVLMDYRMPSLDGVNAARRMRDDGSEAAIIIVTGSQTDFTHLTDAGVTAYVRKEHGLAALLDTLYDVAALGTRLGAPL